MRSQKGRNVNIMFIQSESKNMFYRYLDMAVNENSTLDTSHRATVFAAVYGAGNVGLSFAMNYVKEHHVEISK